MRHAVTHRISLKFVDVCLGLDLLPEATIDGCQNEPVKETKYAHSRSTGHLSKVSTVPLAERLKVASLVSGNSL